MGIAVGLHIDVDGRLHRKRRRFILVSCHPVVHKLEDRGVVGDDGTGESPFRSQHIVQEPAVRRRRHPIHGIEACHHHLRAGIDCCLVGRKILLAQTPLAHVDRVVLAPAFHRTVAGKVLDAGSDALAFGKPRLEAPDHCLREARTQIGILPSRHLHDTAPARIAHHIDCRTEGHHAAVGSGFIGNEAIILFYACWIPGTAESQRYRIAGLVAVDHVRHEEQRYVEAALCEIAVLDAVHLIGTDDIEDAAAPVDIFLGHADLCGRPGRDISSPEAVSAELHQLSDLLVERHLVQQCAQLSVFHGKAFLQRFFDAEAVAGVRSRRPPEKGGSYSAVSRSILSE